MRTIRAIKKDIDTEQNLAADLRNSEKISDLHRELLQVIRGSKILVTVESVHGENQEYVVRITQEYVAEYDMGHYRGFISNRGDILAVFQTMNACPDGKITVETCKKEFERWKRQI